MPGDEYQPLMIALIDAARNCAQESADVTLSLKGGRTVTGRMGKPPSGARDVMVETREGGGWATVLISEIAGVASHRRGTISPFM